MPPRRNPRPVADSPATDAWAEAARAHLTAQGAHSMSDTGQAEGQEPEAAEGTGQAPETTQATGTTPEPTAAADDSWKAELKAARAEAAKYRTQLRALEAEATKEREAKLSDAERAVAEAERAKAEAEKLKAELATLALRAEVSAQAQALGFHEADVALALLDRGALEYGDDGRPQPDSVKAALATIAEARPYLVKQQGAASTGPGGNPARQQGEPAETVDQRRARIYGGQVGGNPMIDAEAARRAGGGVVISPRSLDA